jgi:hypothetical protein
LWWIFSVLCHAFVHLWWIFSSALSCICRLVVDFFQCLVIHLSTFGRIFFSAFQAFVVNFFQCGRKPPIKKDAQQSEVTSLDKLTVTNTINMLSLHKVRHQTNNSHV